MTHPYREVSGRLDAVAVCRPATSDRGDRRTRALAYHHARPRTAIWTLHATSSSSWRRAQATLDPAVANPRRVTEVGEPMILFK